MTSVVDLGRFDYESDDFLPLVAHHSPQVCLMLDGSYMASVRVPGFEFHMQAGGERNVRRKQLNTLLMNVADDNVTMAVHFIRHRTVPPFSEGAFRSEFAGSLNRRYRASIADKAMTNEWFVSLIVAPRFTPSKPWNRLKQKLGRKAGEAPRGAVEESIQALEDRVYIVMSYLREAGARRLGVRHDKNGIEHSEIAEATRLILYGEWSPVPIVDGPLGGAVYNQRARCGHHGVEINAFGGSRYCMMLGLKRYMMSTRTGMLDELQAAEFPFVMTSAIHFESVAASSTSLMLHKIRMDNAGDVGATTEGGLVDARKRLMAGKEVRGDHHFSLAVYGDTHAEMMSHAGEAAKIIGNMGAIPAQEDRGSFGSYWAQLPGQLDWLRTRPGEITSPNFTAFATFDGMPTGSRSGWWGESLCRFLTSHGTVYDYSPFVHDVGHTMFLGRTGRGKTALMTFLCTTLEKAMGSSGTTVYLDKDRGAEPMIRACGGRYLQFRRGCASGCAPLLGVANTPDGHAFLQFWLQSLIELDGRGPIAPDETRRLARGIARQMKMPAELRSFGGIREFLGYANNAGAGGRFERWCAGGSLGWAFDNKSDDIRTDAQLLGFDLTALFDDPVVCSATAAYLIHRLGGLIDGRRFAVIWDEMRFSLQVPVFAKIIDDFALTLRKKNGILFIATQEPEHILLDREGRKSAVGASLVSQCVNKFVLPARKINRQAYEEVGLTGPQIAMVTEKMPALPFRSVLLQRENESVVLRFDLGGMEDEIAVLSGRLEAMPALDRILAECGTDPDDWLAPWLDAARKVGKTAMEDVR